MTKKNKPASLTSSLLARKGEAEPAEARPYLVPDNPDASAAQSGNDNGNGGSEAGGNAENKDLFGLGNFPLPELSEKSLRAAEFEQGETPSSAEPAAPPFPAPSSEPAAATPAAPTSPAPSSQPVAATPAAPTSPAPSSAPAAPISSAPASAPSAPTSPASEPPEPHLNVADSPPPPGAAEAAALSMAAARPMAGPTVGPTADGAPDPEILDLEQETVRDARLLKFVYVMAALTGILAIVIYSGGWFIDDGAQQTAKQETPWTPPAQTAAKPDEAAPVDRPAESDPAKPAADNPPASAMSGDAEKPMEQPADAAAAPEESMAATTPELPASSRVLREGDGGAAKTASGDIGNAPTPPAVAQPETSTALSPSGEVARASGEPSGSVPPATSPGTIAETPTRSDTAVMTDKIERGSTVDTAATSAKTAAPATMPEKTEQTPTGQASTATPDQAKAAAPEKAPVAMVTPSEVAPPLAKPTGRFLIQLSSVKSQERADREWARLKKSFPKELANLELIIEKRTIASRGTFFRVQTGRFETISEARAICAVLAAKKQGCLPIKR